MCGLCLDGQSRKSARRRKRGIVASERDVKKAAEFFARDLPTDKEYIGALAEALAAERIAGMEEAAKIAENYAYVVRAVKAIRRAIEAEKKGAGL